MHVLFWYPLPVITDPVILLTVSILTIFSNVPISFRYNPLKKHFQFSCLSSDLVSRSFWDSRFPQNGFCLKIWYYVQVLNGHSFLCLINVFVATEDGFSKKQLLWFPPCDLSALNSHGEITPLGHCTQWLSELRTGQGFQGFWSRHCVRKLSKLDSFFALYIFPLISLSDNVMGDPIL